MNSLPSTPCYLNGAFTPLCDAKISVMDRGFIFGDGIYEVVPVYNGRPFRFSQHMARLERSLVEMRMTNPHTREQWLGIAMGLIGHGAKAQGVAPDTLHQLVYIQITRGVAMRDHVMPTDIVPTVFAMATVMRPPSGCTDAATRPLTPSPARSTRRKPWRRMAAAAVRVSPASKFT